MCGKTGLRWNFFIFIHSIPYLTIDYQTMIECALRGRFNVVLKTSCNFMGKFFYIKWEYNFLMGHIMGYGYLAKRYLCHSNMLFKTK